MNNIIERKVYNTLLGSIALTILLFTLSLICNAYYTKESQNSVGMLGISTLLLGFFSVNISWLANPCLVISLIHLKRENLKKALIFSFISVIFGFYDQVIVDEAGNKAEITAYGLWYWLSSLIINLIGLSLTDMFIKTNKYY